MDTITTQPIKLLYRATQVIWYVVSIVETLLLFRLGLRLVGANPGAGFSELIYQLTAPLVRPFLGVLTTIRTGPGVIEWPTALAMLMYWMLAWAVVKLLLMSRPVSTWEADVRLRHQERNQIL